MDVTTNTLILVFCLAGIFTVETLKLSDLPVLKRWEVPKHEQQPAFIGRKYKNLEDPSRRNTHWEPKQEFTDKELDWDEDPEKLALDFNYKAFFEDGDDQETDIRRELGMSGKVANETSVKKFGISKPHAVNTKKAETPKRAVSQAETRGVVAIHDDEDEKTKLTFNANKVQALHDDDIPVRTTKGVKKSSGAKSSSGKELGKKLMERKFDKDSSMKRGLKPSKVSGKDPSLKSRANVVTKVSDKRTSVRRHGDDSLEEVAKRAKVVLLHQLNKRSKQRRSRKKSTDKRVDRVLKRHVFALSGESSDKSRRRTRRSTESFNENGTNDQQKPVGIRERRAFNQQEMEFAKRDIMAEVLHQAQLAQNKLTNLRRDVKQTQTPNLQMLTVKGRPSPRAPIPQQVTGGDHAKIQQKAMESSRKEALKMLNHANQDKVDHTTSAGMKKPVNNINVINNSGPQKDRIGNHVKQTALDKPQLVRFRNPKDSVKQDPKLKTNYIIQREKIERPKEKADINIVPGNVARAVAMAVEQLKRDKMWGKVFVHMRPNGQLKVMVQETRKMDEEQ